LISQGRFALIVRLSANTIDWPIGGSRWRKREGSRIVSVSTVADIFLSSIQSRFRWIKILGDRSLAQISDEDFRWQPEEESNSIAMIVRHLRGNMLSRWTDFLTSDGEKPTRHRDTEFEGVDSLSVEEGVRLWDEGWDCLLAAIDSLGPDDLTKEVLLRGEGLPVIDAIERQYAHAAMHVGQIIWVAKHRKGSDWKTLSIPRGKSEEFFRTGESHFR